jgi:hypothetical protein
LLRDVLLTRADTHRTAAASAGKITKYEYECMKPYEATDYPFDPTNVEAKQ